MTSLYQLATWFALYSLFTVLALPLSRRFVCAGILGLAIFSWLAFAGSRIGLLTFTGDGLGILFAVLVAIYLAAFLVARRRGVWRDYFLPRAEAWESFLVLALLVAFFAWITGLRPEIQGSEKISDFHFLRAVLDSHRLPAGDTWFGGAPINYYYFGYVVIAALAKLAAPVAGLEAGTIYNLGVVWCASLFGLVMFETARALTGSRWAGLVALSLALLVGNLHGVIDFVKLCRGWQESAPFFWPASRAVAGAITEFPFFSAVLGDLHAHFMVLPWATLFLLLLAVEAPAVTLGFAGGIVHMMNSWFTPIFLLMAAMSFWRKRAVRDLALFGGAFLMTILPLISHLQRADRLVLKWLPLSTYTGGFDFVRAWGALWLPLGAVWLAQQRQHWLPWCREKRWWPVALPLVGFLLLKPALHLAFFGAIFVVVSRLYFKREPRDFSTLLLATMLGVGIFLELLYFDDLYGPPFIRLNTVFKFSYLFFLGLPLLWAVWLSRYKRFCVICIATLSLYSVGTLYELVRQDKTWTLDGLRFLEYQHSGEAALVGWLREQLLGTDAILLERLEQSHAWGGRLSAFSGISSPLNWQTSQAIWRGAKSGEVAMRFRDLQIIYNGEPEGIVVPLLEKYRISHVIITPYERSVYKLKFDFAKQYPLVYNFDNIQVYQTRPVTPNN